VTNGKGSSRRAVFWIQIAYLAGLGLFVILYRVHTIEPRRDFFGPIPFLVPWFGAIGAVLLSLSGVFDHRNDGDWDPRYCYWHWSRPVIGGVVSVVSVLILQSGILAVGGQLPSQADTRGPKYLLYYLVAFVAGYREDVFRQLVKRFADVILTPPAGPPPKPVIGSATPPNAAAAQETQVTIAGSGLTGTTSVKLGTSSIPFVGNSDFQVTATIPASTSAEATTLSVTTAGGTASIDFPVIGA
jgi:hypothetical protein